MHKGFLRIGALLGALSVILGAMAAHKLKDILSENQLSIFNKGVQYQFYHVFALIAVGILFEKLNQKLLTVAGLFFCLGILFFSGSLYFLSLFTGTISDSFKWLYLVTPLGGICFIAGWLWLFAALVKKNKASE